MKKFLSFILFLAVACGMMLLIGDDLRLMVQDAIPGFTLPIGTSGSQSGETEANGTGDSGEKPEAPAPIPPTPILTDGGYYFDQLSDASKTVYSAIYRDPLKTDGIAIRFASAIEVTLADGESEDEAKERLQGLLLSEIQPALDALVYDHPEIDWMRMGDGDGSTFQFTPKHDGNRIYIDYMEFTLVTEDREGGAEAHLDALTAAVNSVDLNGTSRYELLLAIQREICARTVYTLDGIYAHDAAGVFLEGEAVCDGYAKAFKLLCDRFGIPCVIVVGRAVQSSGSEAHAWNYVQMEDGNWYAVDVTWNDKETAEPSTDYFLVGLHTRKSPSSVPFCETHLPNGHFSGGNYEAFSFPALSNGRYEPPAEEDPPTDAVAA